MKSFSLRKTGGISAIIIVSKYFKVACGVPGYIRTYTGHRIKVSAALPPINNPWLYFQIFRRKDLDANPIKIPGGIIGCKRCLVFPVLCLIQPLLQHVARHSGLANHVRRTWPRQSWPASGNSIFYISHCNILRWVRLMLTSIFCYQFSSEKSR